MISRRNKEHPKSKWEKGRRSERGEKRRKKRYIPWIKTLKP
jgi:hypothetical protein